MARAPGGLTRVRVGARALRAAAWTSTILVGYDLHRRWCTRIVGRPTPPSFDPYLKAWAAGMLRSVRAQVHADSVPPAHKARLIVSNHRCALDIPLLLHVFGGAPVSRGDLAGWPLLGLGAKNAGAVFVDPDDPRGRASSIRAIRTLLTAGRTVTLFAEGTTYAGDEVRPFQPGGLAACRGLDVEILPVGLAYGAGTEYVEDDFLEHVRTLAARGSTRVVMTVGSPLPLGQPFRATSLAERARDAVQDLVEVSRRRFERLG